MPIRPSLHRALAAGIAVILLALPGCGSSERDRQGFDARGGGKFKDDERREIQAEIELLAKGKDHDDVEASAAYSEALGKLTARGSSIEPQLIEALVGHPDWAVRLGVIEALNSIGGKACIEPLIATLKDPVPLVALHADKLLEVMCKHREIPGAGQPTAPSGLPPVPRPPAGDLALDAEERQWAAWHGEYALLLHKSWSDWWKANRATVKVD